MNAEYAGFFSFYVFYTHFIKTALLCGLFIVFRVTCSLQKKLNYELRKLQSTL